MLKMEMMRRSFFTALMMLALCGTVYGQEVKSDPQVNRAEHAARAISKLTEVNKAWHSSEQMPEFPGGDKALMDFLRTHIKYPMHAAKFGVEGRVVVTFVVQRDGSVTDFKIAKSVDKELDEEALRVCKLLPKFTPATKDGEPVPVWYTLPVTFKLNKKPDFEEMAPTKW